MARNEQLTIGEILEMTPGDKDNPTWINGDITAVVADRKQRQTNQGLTFFTCTLVDPDNENNQIAASFFGRKMFPTDGATVIVGGSGISLGEYNGNLQLSAGAKASVNTVSGGNSAPSRPSSSRSGSGQPPARGSAPAARESAILGQTVGMVINRATEWARERAGTVEEPSWLGSGECHRWVYEQASHLLRTAALLEKGKVANNREEWLAAINQTQEQEAAPPARAAQRPAPGPDGSVANNPDEEDVPF